MRILQLAKATMPRSLDFHQQYEDPAENHLGVEFIVICPYCANV